ncbi:ferritin-like domain-containing protein [Enhygromyxa salina]|uniref:Lipoprotein n=1 Tax=Enhygromyxa salina TaxID=215803 RepID=A0A2S9YC30_9BACT|nr:ferritin-like domain-containing protein [Enhygromyxa salina]PRQ02655.1 hypothetical protein ENSA7_54840 [Enhygromyxa salina]
MARRSPVDQLRRYLITSLGLVSPLLLPACGGAVISDGDDGGVTTDPSGGGSSLDDGTSSDPGMATSSTPGTTGTEGAETDDPDPPPPPPPPVKFDLPPEPDLPPLGACTVTYTETSTLDEYPECPIELEDGICWSGLYWGCVEPQPGQSCAEICPDGDCIAEWWDCEGDMIYEAPVDYCGPYEIDGMCCTLAEGEEECGTDGRPFVVGGVSRQAALRVLARPTATAGAGLPERVREQLAARWAASARAEHASIASFAQFAARLQALGCPASLVADALAAAADEVRHAQFALALAGQHGAQTLEFGPLDTRGAARPDPSLTDTLLACVREGCIGETLAALELGTVAQHCDDPELAAALQAIADDEARHAALAWRFVQWGLRREPGFAASLMALLDSVELRLEASGRIEVLDASERALLRATGCLPADERRRVKREGLRDLVLPCARALLAAHADSQPSASA